MEEYNGLKVPLLARTKTIDAERIQTELCHHSLSLNCKNIIGCPDCLFGAENILVFKKWIKVKLK